MTTMTPSTHRPPVAQRVRTIKLGPATVALACLAVAGLADAVLRHESGASGDEPFYLAIAAHPGRAHSFPYAYRVLVPWLVHILPFSQIVSFQLLALLAIAVAGGGLYVLMRHFDIGATLAAALAVAFAVSPNLLVTLLRHGQSIDPASTLVMILGCLFIVRRQRFAVAATLIVGVAIKETSLFLVPFAYAVWARRLIDREALRDTILIAVGPICAYALLRVLIPAVGSQYVPGYGNVSWLQTRIDILRSALSTTALKRAAYAYGPLWLIAPVALLTLPFARRGLVLVLICVVALTVSFDTGRIIFLAVPVFYVAAGSVLQDHRRLAVVGLLALCAVDAGYAAYMQLHGVQYGLDTTLRSAIGVR